MSTCDPRRVSERGERERCDAPVPWEEEQFGNWPSSTVQAGAEVGMLSVNRGYSTAIDVYFNPNGQTIPVGAYQLNVYACGQNFKCLIVSQVLVSGDPQRIAACAACRSWEVTLTLLSTVSAPSYGQRPPMVSAIAHGREASC